MPAHHFKCWKLLLSVGGPILEQHLTSAIFHWISISGETSTYPSTFRFSCASLCTFIGIRVSLVATTTNIQHEYISAYQHDCYFEWNMTLLYITIETLMTLLWMVNQPLVAAMTWAAVVHMLCNDNRTTSIIMINRYGESLLSVLPHQLTLLCRSVDV